MLSGGWTPKLLLLSVLASAPPAAAQQKAARASATAVRAAIERANAEWAVAALRHDASAIAAQYTEDAIIMGPGAPAGVGRAIVRTGVAEMPGIREPSLTIAEVEVFDTTAVERGTFRMTLAVPGQAPMTDVGKYLVVWKQGSDGAWRRHREVFNSDLPPAPPPAGSTVDVAAVRAAIEGQNLAWSAATNREDAAGVAAVYAEDALVMPQDGPAVQGRAAIQAAAAVNVQVIRDASLTTAEVEAFGGTAIERGVYDMTMVFPGQAPFQAHGKYLVVWRQDQDGAWRMRRQIFNSDQPPPRK